jgi:hypothetical protein
MSPNNLNGQIFYGALKCALNVMDNNLRETTLNFQVHGPTFLEEYLDRA